MFQPPYRAAVIGRTGRGDYGHGLDVAFRDDARLKLVAVSDDNDAGRAAAAKRLNVDHAYADYREMLDREKPEFVAVCPRWLDSHAEIVTACAERGVRGIFCEKPLARTPAECDAIVNACHSAHCKLVMAFQTRVSPIFAQVKKLVAEGAIGEPLEVRGRGKEDRRGGGEDLMVLGSHIMDLFRGLLGDAAWCFARVTEAGAPIGRAQVLDGAEGIGPLAGDRIDATYGFTGSPVLAHFGTSRPSKPGGRFDIRIYGSEGCIVMGFGWMPPAFLLRDPLWHDATGRSKWEPITSAGPGQPEPLPSASTEAGNRVLVDTLIRSVEQDTQPVPGVDDGRASIEMILATYASQLAGAKVDLPLADRKHPLEALAKS